MYFNPLYYQQSSLMFDYPSLCLNDYSQLHHLLHQAQLERQAAFYEQEHRKIQKIQRALYNLNVLTELQRRREQEELAIRAYYEKKREQQELLRRQQYLAAMKQNFLDRCPVVKTQGAPLAYQPVFVTPQEFEDEEDEEEEHSEQLSNLVKWLFGAQSKESTSQEPVSFEAPKREEARTEAPKREKVGAEVPQDTCAEEWMDEDTAQDITAQDILNDNIPVEPMVEEAAQDIDIVNTPYDSMAEDVPSLIEQPKENIKELVNELIETSEDTDLSIFPREDPVKLAKYEALSRIEQELQDIRQKREKHVLHSTLNFSIEHGQLPDNLVASTAGNREFLGYEDEIMKILLKLDTIKSEGDKDIRTERKRLVKQAEAMLEILDEYKQREWERVSNGSSVSEDEYVKV